MTTTELSLFINEQSRLLGFDACGFARAEALPETEHTHFLDWLKEGRHGEMNYLSRYLDIRMDPRLLVDGCRSIVVVALNYFSLLEQPPGSPKIARFAFGSDYHGLIRAKLKTLLTRIREQGIEVNGRAFSDSAPIAERYWAWKAGLGWKGKNQQLLLPGKGSFFLLGELVLDLELEYGIPMESRCGTCTRCLESCPTQALHENHLDASHCLSYLTIEKKEPFSVKESKTVGESTYVFGCDICQEACPWNRFASPNTTLELQPSKGFLALDENGFRQLTPATFKTIFSGTCLERIGLEGLLHNLKQKK
jgi:epoxyqueuosine reductase